MTLGLWAFWFSQAGKNGKNRFGAQPKNNYNYLFPTRVSKPPTTINILGVNDDNGPINPVRFMFPKFPNKKSAAQVLLICNQVFASNYIISKK